MVVVVNIGQHQPLARVQPDVKLEAAPTHAMATQLDVAAFRLLRAQGSQLRAARGVPGHIQHRSHRCLHRATAACRARDMARIGRFVALEAEA
jgi:hypothetical protein